EQMCATVREAVTAARLALPQVLAIGVATPGTMDIPAGVILDPPNLRPWRNVPVRRYVEDKFRVPTAFQNDANAAPFRPDLGGGGRTARVASSPTGRGGGGGPIKAEQWGKGKTRRGAGPAHKKRKMPTPRQCGCGRWGCLEAYASATAVVKRTLDALAADAKR